MYILIVEDDPFVAAELELLIGDVVQAEIVVVDTVAEALRLAKASVTFAFLDVDVTNGKTFKVAQKLVDANVPFAFVSGSRHEDVPTEFVDAEWIAKPFAGRDIQRVARAMEEVARA